MQMIRFFPSHIVTVYVVDIRTTYTNLNLYFVGCKSWFFMYFIWQDAAALHPARYVIIYENICFLQLRFFCITSLIIKIFANRFILQLPDSV